HMSVDITRRAKEPTKVRGGRPIRSQPKILAAIKPAEVNLNGLQLAKVRREVCTSQERTGHQNRGQASREPSHNLLSDKPLRFTSAGFIAASIFGWLLIGRPPRTLVGSL